jgi:hypothetical protein
MDRLRKFLRENRSGGVCAFAWIDKEDRLIEHARAICHASLTPRPQRYKKAYVDNSFPQVLATSFYKGITEYWQEFNDWIVSEESPWKAALDGHELVYDKKELVGIILPNQMVDARIIGNFCVAARIASEHPQIVDNWKVFLDEGFHPSMALYLASNFKVHAGGIMPSSIGNMNHWPFDNAREVNLKVLVEGVKDTGRNLMANGGSYRSWDYKYPEDPKSCNSIWWGKDQFKYDCEKFVKTTFSSIPKASLEDLVKTAHAWFEKTYKRG